MKINIEIELQPFHVPSYAIALSKSRPKEEGYKESPKYHLSELSSEVLDKMCDEFRIEVFKKAGKEIPMKITQE